MNTKIMTRIVALLCIITLLVSACGSSTDSADTTEPESAPTATPSVEPEQTGDDAVELDGTDTDSNDEPTPEPTATIEKGQPRAGAPVVLLAVFTSGGFVPVDIALNAFPELVVMSDGVAFRPGVQIATFPPPLTAAIERVQLDDDALREIVALVSGSDIPAAGFDFGSPNVIDVGTTAVTLLRNAEVDTLSAYALGFANGVTGTQAEARAELFALISSIETIVDGASATGELTEPMALALLSFPGLGFEENAIILDWPIASVPLPQESGGADCVIVEGEELATLWAAAAGATTQTPWNIEGQPKVVAFRPVFPHEDIC